MQSKKVCIRSILIMSLGLLLLIVPAYAEESKEELKQQIESLNKRVTELEEELKNKPDSLRDSFNERFRRDGNPFLEFDRIQEEMNRTFQNSFGRFGDTRGMFSGNMSIDSELDLKETENGYEIRFDMTGLDKEKVDIEINEHSITVKGKYSKQDTEESQNIYFSSQSFGSFMKTIPLPVDADTTKVKTEKEGDTLVIRLPKKNT